MKPWRSGRLTQAENAIWSRFLEVRACQHHPRGALPIGPPNLSIAHPFVRLPFFRFARRRHAFFLRLHRSSAAIVRSRKISAPVTGFPRIDETEGLGTLLTQLPLHTCQRRYGRATAAILNSC